MGQRDRCTEHLLFHTLVIGVVGACLMRNSHWVDGGGLIIWCITVWLVVVSLSPILMMAWAANLLLFTSCIPDMFNKTLSSKDTLHWTQPYHMKRIVQNIFAHRHAVFTIISVLHQVCYQSKLCVALSDLYVGWVWFGLVCKTLSNLVLHGSEGSSSRAIRCNTCCCSPGAAWHQIC